MKLPARKKLLMLSAIALVTVALGACGRRGPLEPHPDAPAEQRARPQASDQQGASTTTRTAVTGSRRTLSAPIPPPKQPFILDALL